MWLWGFLVPLFPRPYQPLRLSFLVLSSFSSFCASAFLRILSFLLLHFLPNLFPFLNLFPVFPFPLSCTTRVDVDCLLLLVCCCGLLCGCRTCRFRSSWRCWNSTPFNSVRGLGANVVVMLSHNVFVPNPTSANCLVNLVFVPKQ